MGCLALSYYEQALPKKSGRSVFLSTAKAAQRSALQIEIAVQRCPQGNEKSCAGSYKFGFNGQEKVNEIAGIGNHTTALFWEYDTRIARRWNLDPVDQISISNYATFGLNPIYNKDVLGNVIEPWWLSSKPGDRIPGYGGGAKSPYKSFLLGDKYVSENLDNFNRTAIGLYNSNSIFKKTVDMLQSSKTTYRVQQHNETNANGVNASYSQENKTVKFGYYGIDKTELFEEVFHAGQDDYYSAQGIGRSGLANEVEAKVANLVSGFNDFSIKPNRDYSALKDYFNTGKKGKGFDAALGNLITDTYETYKRARGDGWAKQNDPSTVDRATVLKYLESTTGISTDSK